MDFATSKASISPDGKQLILVSFDNEILAWDYAAQRKPKSLMTFSGQQEVSSITWSEIKNLVAIGFNGGNKATIELFNTINWNQNKGIVLEGSGVRDISFSYDGIHLAALQYHTSELHFLNIDKKTFDSVTLSNNSKHHSHGQNSGAGSVSWNHYTSQIAAGCNDGIIDIIESSDYDKKQLQTSSSQYANPVPFTVFKGSFIDADGIIHPREQIDFHTNGYDINGNPYHYLKVGQNRIYWIFNKQMYDNDNNPVDLRLPAGHSIQIEYETKVK